MVGLIKIVAIIIMLDLFFKKKLYGPFFLDEVQLSQDSRVTTRRQFSFNHFLNPQEFLMLI